MTKSENKLIWMVKTLKSGDLREFFWGMHATRPKPEKNSRCARKSPHIKVFIQISLFALLVIQIRDIH